jgi:hypothetical protein
VIHELVIYNGLLTDTEILTVTAAMRTKWGVLPYATQMPSTQSAQVAFRWDATLADTLQTTTAKWTQVAGTAYPAIALQGSSPSSVSRVTSPAGVYIATGALMGTVSALPVPLVGRCVVLVATLRSPATTVSRTLLALRSLTQGTKILPGGVLLNAGTATIVSVAGDGAGWISSWYGNVTVPAYDRPQVWLFRSGFGVTRGLLAVR